MSELTKNYIMISGTILLFILNIGICWLCNYLPELVIIFSYVLGIANGMLIIGLLNSDD